MIKYNKKKLRKMLKIVDYIIYNPKYPNIYERKISNYDYIYICQNITNACCKLKIFGVTARDVFNFMGLSPKKDLGYTVFTQHVDRNYHPSTMNKRYNFLLFTKLALEDAIKS